MMTNYRLNKVSAPDPAHGRGLGRGTCEATFRKTLTPNPSPNAGRGELVGSMKEWSAFRAPSPFVKGGGRDGGPFAARKAFFLAAATFRRPLTQLGLSSCPGLQHRAARSPLSPQRTRWLPSPNSGRGAGGEGCPWGLQPLTAGFACSKRTPTPALLPQASGRRSPRIGWPR